MAKPCALIVDRRVFLIVHNYCQRQYNSTEPVQFFCRLHANDRVDPFVAVYDPPSPSYIGEITHLQWKGLLSPAFVQNILNAIV